MKKVTLRILRLLALLLSIVAAVVLVATAYAGKADPQEHHFVAVIGLAFPFLLYALLALTVIWLILRQWASAIVLVVAMIASAEPILTLSPLNIGGGLNEDDSDRAFTLLTFNTMHFFDHAADSFFVEYPNRTAQFILDVDADVVCFQEFVSKYQLHEQETARKCLNDLCERYPYVVGKEGEHELVLFSKYPVIRDSILKGKARYSTYSHIFDLEIKGHQLRIYNCHLQSIGLSDTKVEFDNSIPQLRHTDNATVDKDTIVSRLSTAFCLRAQQARCIRQSIDSAQTDNVIVCGDFNDTPGSFSYRTVRGNDLNDAYRQCAFGPTITFHGNHYYFRIDHVLYRGSLQAVDIVRPDIDCSDHYPLLTTFVWDD